MDNRGHLKLRLIALALVMLALGTVAGSPPAVNPPPPRQLLPTGDCYADNVFYGAVPPWGRTGRVIVFVHGLSGLAQDWWSVNLNTGINDMYSLAYHAGYRTAFVNVNVDPDSPDDCTVARRPASAMMGSGFVIRQQLEAITKHYGVRQVEVVAHSKGGVDTQAAIVWWGGWRYVRNLFTLGTPHQGSLLADLLWSPDGFWVGALLGQRDDATYSMQTGSMALFRSVTDPSLVDDAITYYSGAGDFWQTPGSIYLLTGKWLQEQADGGDNDGLVTVARTDLPEAIPLFLEPWNHAELYQGHNAFPYIHQVLQNKSSQNSRVYLPLILNSGSSATTALPPGGRQPLTTPEPAAAWLALNQILRGGHLTGSATEHFPVESRVRSLDATLFTTEKNLTATLVGPGGAVYALPAMVNNSQGIFESAFLRGLTHHHPAPGRWTLHLDSPSEAGYLLIITLNSRVQLALTGLPARPVPPGQSLQIAVHNRATQRPAQVDQIRLQATRPISDPGGMGLEAFSSTTGPTLDYNLTQEAVYNLSVTVTGQTGDGWPFERSVVRSVAVVRPDRLHGSNHLSVLNMLRGR